MVVAGIVGLLIVFILTNLLIWLPFLPGVLGSTE